MTEALQELPPQTEEAEQQNKESPAIQAELLEKIEANTHKQAECAKKQLGLTRLCTVFMGGMLALCIAISAVFVPRVDGILTQAQEAVTNIKTVSDNLAGVDYYELISNVDSLIATGNTGIAQALSDVERAIDVIEQFDIKTLNSAIADLNQIVAPLASFFGRT